MGRWPWSPGKGHLPRITRWIADAQMIEDNFLELQQTPRLQWPDLKDNTTKAQNIQPKSVIDIEGASNTPWAGSALPRWVSHSGIHLLWNDFLSPVQLTVRKSSNKLSQHVLRMSHLANFCLIFTLTLWRRACRNYSLHVSDKGPEMNCFCQYCRQFATRRGLWYVKLLRYRVFIFHIIVWCGLAVGRWGGFCIHSEVRAPSVWRSPWACEPLPFHACLEWKKKNSI